MGDRVNYGFKNPYDDLKIVLYSHYGGSYAKQNLAAALDQARPRWDDYSYANRIVTSLLIGDSWNSEYGFGLHTAYDMTEEENGYLLVDWDKQSVTISPNRYEVEEKSVVTMGFEEFITQYKN